MLFIQKMSPEPLRSPSKKADFLSAKQALKHDRFSSIRKISSEISMQEKCVVTMYMKDRCITQAKRTNPLEKLYTVWIHLD